MDPAEAKPLSGVWRVPIFCSLVASHQLGNATTHLPAGVFHTRLRPGGPRHGTTSTWCSRLPARDDRRGTGGPAAGAGARRFRPGAPSPSRWSSPTRPTGSGTAQMRDSFQLQPGGPALKLMPNLTGFGPRRPTTSCTGRYKPTPTAGLPDSSSSRRCSLWYAETLCFRWLDESSGGPLTNIEASESWASSPSERSTEPRSR
jgi:hypothetical protein